MLTIIINNSGGELDRRDAATAREAARKLIEIIESVGELYDGDSFVISGEEEPE